jgi:dolichol kinase
MSEIDKGTINFKGELLRKTIHLFSLSIPIIYSFISKTTALSILIPLTIVSVTIDFGRYYIKKLNDVVQKIFGYILREHENDFKKKNLNGASYVLIAATLTLWIFPKIFFITAFATLIISDTSAALIGRKFGKHKFLSKSLEGTLAFFVSGCIVIFFTPKVANLPEEYIIGFVAIAVGAIIENISYGWADDNLTIPLSIGFTLWGLYAYFLPTLTF